MIRAKQVIRDECVLIGIEHDVEADVTIHMEGELPSLTHMRGKNLIEFSAGVVHHRFPTRSEWDLRMLNQGGIQIRERRRNGSNPR